MMYCTILTLLMSSYKFGSNIALLRKSYLQKEFSPLAYVFAKTSCALILDVIITIVACNGVAYISNLNNHDFLHILR